MTTRERLAEQLLRRGDYRAILDQLADVIRTPLAASVTLRFAVAQALALTGRGADAERLFEADLRGIAEQAKRDFVLGILAERAGQLERALRHYTQASRASRATNDLTLTAWSELRRFGLLLEGHATDALTAMLPALRTTCVRSGDPSANCYLHLCAAVLAGQTGQFAEAQRHCDLADAILVEAPHGPFSAANAINRGCLAIMAGQLTEAAALFSEAKESASRAGDPFIAGRADANLAHVLLATGDLSAAEPLLTEAIRGGRLGKLGEVGALDGLARLQLAKGDYDGCHATISAVLALRDKHESMPSIYHVRWAALTNTRLLLKQGKTKEAFDYLNRLKGRSADIRDVPFKAAVAITTAVTAGLLGLAHVGAAELWSATELGIRDIVELQPQYYFAASLVLHEFDSDLSASLRRRSMALWRSRGAITQRIEADPSPISLSSARLEVATARPRTPRTIPEALSMAVAILDLGGQPRALGAELLALLDALDCCPEAELALGQSVPPKDAAIYLGFDGVRHVSLTCPVPINPAAALLLGEVKRLATHAIRMSAVQAKSIARPLWADDTIESQGDSVVVSEQMRALVDMARRIGVTSAPVLITGETGTGKEVLARLIHSYSSRAKRGFVPFNCGAVPKDILDAQLFGHRRGAFTGATEHSLGVIRGASGGTLFLDEIGELSLDLQPKLLRFLESSEVHPIGEPKPLVVDVRVIAATNADLETLIATGRFREDLFYRLDIVRMHVPPLRERREEIPLLARHYLDKHSSDWGKSKLSLSEEAVEYLVLYSWPGNVRQLVNEMRRVAAVADSGTTIMPEHLSKQICSSRVSVRTVPAAIATDEMAVRLDQPLGAAVEHLERAMIQRAMTAANGRLEEAARALGISRKGLYLKRQRLGIEQAPETP